MPRPWVPASLVSLLLAPVALAAEGEGSFTLQGPLRLPDMARTEGVPFTVYLSDTSHPGGTQLQCPLVTVYRIEKRMAAASVAGVPLGQVQTDFRVDSWTLHDVTLLPMQGGNHSGYAGIYPAADSQVAFTGSDGTQAGAMPFSAVGSGKSTDGKTPEDFHYYVTVDQPHILLSGLGAASYGGRGGVKITGMDVEIRAAENVTHHETGRTEADTATLEGSRASEVTLTWLYLQFDAPATVTLAGPVTMATSAADLSWDGAARFTPTNGSLRTPEGTYSTVGGPAKLDGRFTGRLAPLAGEQGRLEVAGEVRSASLRYEPAPLAPGAGSGGFPWGVVLLVGAAVVAVGTGGFATRAILVRRRRTTRPVPAASAPFPFTAEDCLRASHLLLEQDDYPGALEWATRARTLAPTSGEAVSHEAYCLECIGDAEGAMRAYAEAARLMPEDGDMPFLAALQARDVPGHSREAEDWLQRALAKQPANAWDAENAFPHLARNPEWRRIFREAKERAARAGEENEGGPKA